MGKSFLDALKEESSLTRTENNDITYSTTGSSCLDLFALGGAIRKWHPYQIITLIQNAFIEDRDLALKILFYLRDVRKGVGERKLFRYALLWLGTHEPQSVIKNIELIPEYGRFDDLLVLLDTPCKDSVLAFLAKTLTADIENEKNGNPISLLAKWLPSINASNSETRRLAKIVASGFNMDLATYRKTLSRLRTKIDLVENKLRTKDYVGVDYSKVPSNALFRYSTLFMKKDCKRFGNFLNSVSKGEATIHVDNLYPYEIVETLICNGGLTVEERAKFDVLWNSLPDYTKGSHAIAVVDTSNSMTWTRRPMPLAVALSLGIYFAERNNGAFKNHFISFSSEPKLVEIKGKDISEKVLYARNANFNLTTDLEKVFKLLLVTAVKNKSKQEDLPSELYIISDMEFDGCVFGLNKSTLDRAKDLFNDCGYKLPKVVFWNVNSHASHLPARQNEDGVLLVSGCTPRTFELVTSGETNPYDFMMSVVNSIRYKDITA